MESEQQNFAFGISGNHGSGSNSMNDTEELTMSNTQTKEKNSAAKPPKRRPGRPSGSKNKPKNTTINHQKPMKIDFLEVAAGYDLLQYLTQYCKRHDIDLAVFGASGNLSSAAIYQHRRQLQSFPFPSGIISLSGYCSASFSSLTVMLSSSHEVQQGFVGSRLPGSQLIAGADVYVTVAPYVNPSYHKVNYNGEDQSSNSIVYTSSHPSHSQHPRAMVQGHGSSLGSSPVSTSLPDTVNSTRFENVPQMAGASKDCSGKEIRSRASKKSN